MKEKIDIKLVKALRKRTAAGVVSCRDALIDTGGDLDSAVKLLHERHLLPAAIERRPTAEGLIAFLVDGRCGVIVELAAETDFTARNPLFQQAAQAIARTTFTVGGELADTLAAPSPDGQGDIAGYVRRLAATFGENIHVRRASILRTENGLIGAYAHNPQVPGLARMVALVAISGHALGSSGNLVAKKLAMHVVGASPLWSSVNHVPPSIRDQKRLRIDDDREHSPDERDVSSAIEARLERFYDQTVLPRQRYLLDPSMTVAEFLAAEAGSDAHIEGFVCFRIGEDAAHDARVAEAAEFEWTFGNDWSDERPSKLTAIGNERVFEISLRGPKLRDDRDAVDLINAAWSGGATIIALPVERLSTDFFPLSTRKAGAILQKFSNFGTRVAIVGDISSELSASSALRDFVYESNHRGQVVFVPDLKVLTQGLRKSQHDNGDTA
ncbi:MULTISPECIES: translation elongation factor Ts [unclassified Sphingobium]|uniref:translation elongation factor Ts n=1 Tax=unclassified Sphingobium TaxID=2611147 RepID=UPI000D15BA8E|nr:MULTISPECIES: translation elongation factor Ts [unclassified Sphingobium]MBG6118621.1 translation elongation factor Ts [Sphingobium sp. JAI105]PSO13693.1 translation elongation factor Ts [Sphingobium sp. AEW4]TWD10696.1 translation elongation factor Ts [Sphingobium sp. AEW010]TWD27899.1 translation elongation factor Ts [Sphingobium sp. AEW013]TWD29030.1 translation elongation factor Ts [Sphingobium sp. AEW001]